MQKIKILNPEVALKLIKLSDLNIVNIFEETALELAMFREQENIVGALLDAGANPKEIDKTGEPIFMRHMWHMRVKKRAK